MPCSVVYIDENGEYAAIESEEGPYGVHVFVVPEGVRSPAVIVNGDANLDGKLTNADATKIKAVLKGNASLDALSTFAADLNKDNKLSNADSTKIKAYLKGSITLNW